MKFNGVIFDMDGLMVDSERVYTTANELAGNEMGLPFEWDDYLRFVGATDADMRTFFVNHLGSDEKAATFMKRSYELVDKIIKKDGLPMKSGLLTLLDYLETQQIQKGIGSSNYRTAIDSFLEATGLTARFPVIVSGDDVEKGKPEPDIFLLAAAKMNLTTDSALVLEDSRNGLIAANKAKISAILVPDLIEADTEMKELALAVVPDLTKVIDYL